MGECLLAENSVAFCVEPCRTGRIPKLISRFGMLHAVDLDDEAPFQTDKVDDVGANWMLPPQAQSHQPALAEFAPQNALFVSLVGSKFSCPAIRHATASL
jgi:hypothetical protein